MTPYLITVNSPHTCNRFTVYNKISLNKNFAKLSYLCIAEIFGGINFRQCCEGRHILNVIINTGQKIHAIKISPIRADGKIGENFLLAKISVYTIIFISARLFDKSFNMYSMIFHCVVAQATGVMEMRQAVEDKEDAKSLKQKTRERVRPKMGKLTIDYQKLHDAFFKWQTKPKMSIHGDLYYEVNS